MNYFSRVNVNFDLVNWNIFIYVNGYEKLVW